MHQNKAKFRIESMSEGEKIQYFKPNVNLLGMVLVRIEKEKKREAKIHLYYTSALGLSSILFLVPALKYFIADFSASGFGNYFSLLYSDGGTVLSFWKELVITLAESIPVLSSIIILGLVMTLLYVGKSVLQNTKIIFRPQLSWKR